MKTYVLLALPLLLGCSPLRLDAHELFPNAAAAPKQLHGEKAFHTRATSNSLVVHFADVANSDDYVHIDLGKINLKSSGRGGYLEVEAETDNPVLRLAPAVSRPEHFWDYRQFIEGGARLQRGVRTYRFYLDALSPERIDNGSDNLYLMLQDLGGAARGSATVKILKVRLNPETADWKQKKAASYSKQYQWPKIQKIEPLYYEHYEHAVDWKQISSAPFQQQLSLNGSWRKKYFGERTWDYAFLADTQPARPDFSPADWAAVTVPEPAVENQKGGHYWYRRTFELPPDFAKGKAYLRFDDLADEAQIYVNGVLVGSQSSVEKRLDWVAENGSRFPALMELAPKRALAWQNFERCGIAFPFDQTAIPEGANRLVLPIYSGEFPWPLAYDVTSALRPGGNTVSVRLYGNPMAGWWIYRHRDDRSAKNVYGLLGDARLVNIRRPIIKTFAHLPPATVDEKGFVVHRFESELNDDDAQPSKALIFRCGDETVRIPAVVGKRAEAEFRLPAGFDSYQATVSAVDASGVVLDAQTITFNGVVIQVNDRKVFVNGDPFLVRGINASEGVEMDHDRTVTQREFLRTLRLYEQLGINALRLGALQPWYMKQAFEHGMMVMPLSAAASTDLSIGVFGQLENPDFRLATDRQRNLALLVRDQPNVLFWNGGNEIHHTPGYSDRPIMEEYLGAIHDAFRAYDPYQRPVIYSNLDTWKQNWFFPQGQDIVGWNSYVPAQDFAQQIPAIINVAAARPVLLTEYGTSGGKADREGKKIDAWEADMQRKWQLISGTQGLVGGFLYPHHGELEDERGRAFVRGLLAPFSVTRSQQTLSLTNRSEAPMRKLSLLTTQGKGVVHREFAEVLEPGQAITVNLPLKDRGVLEVRYDSHRGLRHSFTQEL